MTETTAPTPGSKRARALFLTVSALVVVAAVALGRAILLPFLLAAVVAYVFMPIVLRIERWRVPRWAAILLVYAVTVGGSIGFVWSVIPTLYDELKSLGSDLPAITQQARNEWLPMVDARLRRWSRIDESATAEPSSTPANAPPIIVKPRYDGGYEVRLQDELEIKPTHDGTWVLRPRTVEPQGFSSERALRDAFDRSITHLQSHSADLVQMGGQLIGFVSRGIFFFFITLMLAGYLMMTWERIHLFFREMWVPRLRADYDRFLARLDRGLAGVVRGQLLICLVNGVLTAIGLWLFHLKYWPVLSIVAGAMSIIPIFGSILSTIPAVALGLTQGPGTAFGVLLWILGIHQLEANFLNPKIIGDQAKIHPVLVVFALLLGESRFGIPGALLAVPCLAIVQAIFMHFRESLLGLRDSDSHAPSPPSVSGRAPRATASERIGEDST